LLQRQAEKANGRQFEQTQTGLVALQPSRLAVRQPLRNKGAEWAGFRPVAQFERCPDYNPRRACGLSRAAQMPLKLVRVRRTTRVLREDARRPKARHIAREKGDGDSSAGGFLQAAGGLRRSGTRAGKVLSERRASLHGTSRMTSAPLHGRTSDPSANAARVNCCFAALALGVMGFGLLFWAGEVIQRFCNNGSWADGRIRSLCPGKQFLLAITFLD